MIIGYIHIYLYINKKSADCDEKKEQHVPMYTIPID